MMEALDALESQSEEVLLDVGLNVRTTNTPGSGTWLEQALNDSECLLAPGGVSECQPNTTLILASANTTTLPPSLGFDDNALTDIIIYSVMFVVAAVGNLTVFITLFRNRHRKSRVNLMIMHLAAADLMVTLINFPLEVGWRITTQWVAGNLACKLFQFLRAFGLYLSSLVLVCISLDRYFAIVHPLKVNDAQRRGKIMLSFAWSTAAVCSLPQSVIFHVDTHPIFKNFRQCVTFGFFRTQVEEMTYNLFCLAAMYFLPLFVIVVVYLRILWEISQKSKDSKEDASNSRGRSGRLRLRRSDMTNIERARARTLRMTVIIVLAFIWCWTPYVVIVMWYMFDRQSAEQVDKRLQDALFIMAVSNSCVNPLVYGTYTINFRNELNRCFGRKTKPPVLARKSTVMTSQDARSTRYQVRSSVTTLDPVQHQGSTAMRTTVTAQLSSGSSIRMSTHTQVVHREGTTRGAGRRITVGENRYSPSKNCHPLPPSPLSKPPAASPTPQGSASCPPAGQGSAAAAAAPPPPPPPPPPSTTTASGCVMVEIEVDVGGQVSQTHASSQDEDEHPDPRPPEPETHGGSPADDRSVTLPPRSEKQIKENGTEGVKLASPPSANCEMQSNGTDSAKLTALLQTGGSPATLSKILKETDAKESLILSRKLSSDSGVFFDSRHKRLQQNSLSDITSDHLEARRPGAQATDIEMKCIRPLAHML